MSNAENKSRYTAGPSLGKGGMGEVLAARDLHFGRSVAMKVIRADRDPSREERVRFVQEARVLSQLEHPNIVPVYDLDKDAQGRVFYTMKQVQGVTLKAVLNQLKTGEPEAVAKYPLNQLLTVFQKVCDAMAFAHSKGIIHRDLKPENIMLGEFGEVLVLDWGLAKILDEGGARHSVRAESGEDGARGATRPTSETGAPEGFHELDDRSRDQALTLEGAVMGTPNFMAPEQAEGKISELDGRTDIFALGGILYSLLTLRAPAGGSSLKEVLENVKRGYIAPPVIYNTARTRTANGGESEQPVELLHCPGGQIPEALSAVAMKAMALDAANRYQTVPELQAEIAKYHGGFATEAEGAGAFRLLALFMKRNKTAGVVSVGALILLTLFFAFVAFSNQRLSQKIKQLKATAPTFYSQARTLADSGEFDRALETLANAIALTRTSPNIASSGRTCCKPRSSFPTRSRNTKRRRSCPPTNRS